MRTFLIAGAAALCCAAAFPAAAARYSNLVQDQANSQSDQQQTQQPRARDANRRICRTARMSQTRIPQRICRTQAEWDMDDATRD